MIRSHPTMAPPRRTFLARALACAGLLALAGSAAAEMAEGREYFRLKNPVPVDTGKKIEVIEFFSYGCPHCADLEPYLQTWMKTLPADVQFRRVPVTFFKPWENLARAYYVVDALGDDGKLSADVFSAIHGGSKVNLADEKKFFEWAASKGYDRKKVEDLYGSFAVVGKVNRAKQLAQTYNVQSVPTVIVDGKFITTSDRAGGHAQMPSAINELVAKARAERPKG